MGHSYNNSNSAVGDKASGEGFLERLSAPARRALQHAGIDTLQKLAGFSEKEVLRLHGIGKASLPVLREVLAKEGLVFKG